MTGQEINRWAEKLKQLRLPLENFYRQCYLYSYPIRGIQFGNESISYTPEQQQQAATEAMASLYDSTATDCCRTLASALVSGLTPANSRWFGLDAGTDADTETKKWLDEAATTIHKAIHQSNFDASIFELMLDVAIPGIGALYVEPGRDGALFNFEHWPLHSCYFASSKRGGLIDIVFRRFTLTAQQAVKEFGRSKVSQKILDALARDPYERFPFVQAIFPRDLDSTPPKATEIHPFVSYHVDLQSKRVCRKNGYHEFPLVVPRWLKLNDSVYAQGPMADALPDVKTLNEMERLVLANADWQTTGMWGAVDDGVLNMKTVKIGPRKVVFMKNKESFFPLNPPGNVQVGEALADKKRSQIRRILMADQLEPMAAGPAKTATEIHYRVNLIRQLLGPAFGRFQSEGLQVLVFRCVGISLRAKALGTPPDGLRERPIRLQYITPLSRAQLLEDVAAMERYEQGLLAKAALVPDVLDVYDWDSSERKKGEYLGVPTYLILDEKKTQEKRDLRSKERQEAIQAAAAAKQGATAPPAAA